MGNENGIEVLTRVAVSDHRLHEESGNEDLRNIEACVFFCPEGADK